eukprot:6175340-Pleurochrysis_carterae.AAC.3
MPVLEGTKVVQDQMMILHHCAPTLTRRFHQVYGYCGAYSLYFGRQRTRRPKSGQTLQNACKKTLNLCSSERANEGQSYDARQTVLKPRLSRRNEGLYSSRAPRSHLCGRVVAAWKGVQRSAAAAAAVEPASRAKPVLQLVNCVRTTAAPCTATQAHSSARLSSFLLRLACSKEYLMTWKSRISEALLLTNLPTRRHS